MAAYSPASSDVTALLKDVGRRDGGRVVATIVGTGGMGKSALLDEIEHRYRRAGRRVARDLSQLDDVVAAEGALLIDDAHLLGDSMVDRARELLVEGPHLFVAYRPRPESPSLAKLASLVEPHPSRITLHPVAPDQVALWAARAAGMPVPDSLVEELITETAGMPGLMRLLLEATDLRDPAATDGGGRAELIAELGRRVESAGDPVHELLLALSVGFELSGTTPPALDNATRQTAIAAAIDEGLLSPDGRVPFIVRRTVLLMTAPYRVRAMKMDLLHSLEAVGGVRGDLARDLAHEGLRDPLIARAIENAADGILLEDPALAITLYDEAAAAGTGASTTAARRAQAASAIGDLDAAGRLIDQVLDEDHDPDLPRAVDAAAAVWAQRGMLARSAEMYAWLGTRLSGASAPAAVIAMIGSGDREGAERIHSEVRDLASPTSANVSAQLAADGVLASLSADTSAALPMLVRASDILTSSGVTIPLPEYPASLAALVALHTGDLRVAESVIDAALTGGQCGAAGRSRLLLLRAYTAMRADQLDRARSVLALAAAGGSGFTPRDEVLFRGVEVGLARRTNDGAALWSAWEHARESLLHVSIDLYGLLGLGELAVAAARLRDSDHLAPHLYEAWSLLARLGEPPLWSNLLRWSGVQAGILLERPSDIAPHAAALVSAASTNQVAAVLAAGGREWIAVLAGEADPATVESVARELAAIGLAWDGSRLAGHAAARTTDRRDMARLLAVARDVRHPQESASDRPPGPGSVGPAGRDDSGLTAREREVARLVLEGKTHREIGEAMFVSPRTAEHHLAQIRRRLGVTTRAEMLERLRAVLATSPDP